MNQVLATTPIETITSYYTTHTAMSDPGPHAALLQAPADPVAALQGALIHVFWAERYGLKLDEQRQSEVTIHTVHRKLDRLLALDARPIDQPRALADRLVANCRDFSLLCASMLRARGVPARARCGFGRYFLPNHYEDHWVVEAWNSAESRWQMLDAQLDAFQREAMHISFDTLDMPAGEFLSGGAAWQMCRRGEADPDSFGIFDMYGWDFIIGNLYRDLAALNKFEPLPWDMLPAMQPPFAESSAERLAALDALADLTTGGNETFAAVRALYEATPAAQVPAAWMED